MTTAASAIAVELKQQPREIEPGIEVGRVLPRLQRRHVGPFVFFDHMGPFVYPPGQGVEVRPHPHIGLATVTYLFEGEILHRDSLGSEQRIHPGAVNWMKAARGIVHSERTPPEVRARGSRMHGIQLWAGLPRERELEDPQFHHYPADSLPEVSFAGARLRVLAGSAYGVVSRVETSSPLFLADAQLSASSELRPPPVPECAAFVAQGTAICEGRRFEAGTLLVFTPQATPVLQAEEATRLILLGGEPLDGPRYVWWNFVSSSQQRIVEAARAWRGKRFPLVPGDEVEFVPLEMEPPFASS